MTPFVSVVITTYNQAEYIEATIASALAQSYPSREIIVVDDGSTDDTAAKLERFGDRIVHIQQPNGGVAASRNRGVAAARGALIAFLDGDDLWAPEKLAVQVAAHQANPAAGLIAVDASIFSDTDTQRVSTLPWGTLASDVPEGGSLTRRFYRELIHRNFISTTSQVMVPADVLEKVGPSDTTLSISSDYDLYLRIASMHDVTLIRKPLARWRYLQTSASGPGEQRQARYDLAAIAALKCHLRAARPECQALIRGTVRRATFDAARAAYDRGCDVDRDRPWAREYLGKLWATSPASPWPMVFCAGLIGPRGLRRAGAALLRLSKYSEDPMSSGDRADRSAARNAAFND
jgi:glycosyltransferase involved in cell wall biosynthesis